ncbi:MAG TPA: glycosyltransferase [Bacteroidales bacterium]|nr:glycosyltransferase [Bacteroidales bacterium]
MILFSAILITIYIIAILWLLTGLLTNKWLKTSKVGSENIHGISVVVAFRNERENLPKLIASLEAQDLPHEHWEAILIDDGSTDNGPNLVMASQNQLPLKPLVLPNGQAGKKQALLLGISQARYDTVVFTDADCIHTPQWLSSIVESMGNADFFQGEVKPQFERGSILSMFEALDYLSLMAVSAASFAVGKPVIASSANLAFRRSKVSVDGKILRTDIASGDDMFLLHHAKSIHGLRFKFLASPQVAVHTSFSGGIKGFISRRSRWASKAKAYTDSLTLLLSILVFTMNLWIVFSAILSVLGVVTFTLPITLVAAKTLVDFPFMAYYLFKTKQQNLLVVFIPLQMVYPFYVTIAAILGLIKGTTWKERTNS